MTTDANTRPSAAEVAEDAGYGRWTLERIADRRNDIDREVNALRTEKGMLDQELVRRAKEARPDFNEEGGTAQIAGSSMTMTVGYDRDWEWNEGEIKKLQLAKDAQGVPLLTELEFSKLATWELKVSGRVYNELLKRGGFIREALLRCRSLKNARPTFTAKARE